jgi:hypothetical protein
MAAHSEDAQKRIIDKEIIKSTIGRSSSPLSLFDRGSAFIISLIRERTRIKSIEEQVKQSEQLVQQAFSDLLARSSAYIFELTAEVRLEKISKEDISKIERLQLFSYFLTDFILYYPYAEDFVQKNTAQIIILTASGKSEIQVTADGGKEIISRKFPIAFAGIHSSLTNFQKEIKEKIAILEEQVRNRISEEKREQISADEDEQEKMLKEDKDHFNLLSREASLEFLIASQKCFDIILSAEKLGSPEEEALKRQLIAVQSIQNDFKAALNISEKKEDKVLSEAKLLTDEEKALLFLKDFYMDARKMSPEEADSTARAALKFEIETAEIEKAEYERAVNASIGSSSAASIPTPPPPPPLTERVTARAKADVLSQGGSKEDIAKVDKMAAAVFSKGGVADFIRDGNYKLNSSEVIKLPNATKNPVFTKADKLEESILHVLSALPEDKELSLLDTGYILIDRETAKARLYHVHEGILVKCTPSDLAPLCGHVSTSLSKGETNKHLELNREEQQKFIVSQGGGHDYSRAEAEAKAKAAEASILAERLSQSGASQKKLPLHEYTKELLKDGQDWPEEAAMANNTFYYKWDKEKNILTGKCTKEDGTIFTDSRTYKTASTITALSKASEQSAQLTVGVIETLKQFAKNAEVQYDKPPAIPSDKKEEEKVENVEPVGNGEKEEEKGKAEEKEEEKEAAVPKAGSSPRVETQLSSSPLSLLASPKSLAKESSANSLAEGSGADSLANSGMRRPR